jgi:PAS domain S-box-containing protein
MKIRSKIYLTALFPVVVGLVVAVVVLQASAQIARATREARTVSAAVRAAFNLNALLGEYLQRGGERARDQWRAVHGQLGETLARLPAASPDERETVRGMAADHADVGALFGELSAPQNAGPERATWRERLTGQLTAKLQRLVGAASLLDERIHEDLGTAVRRAALVILAFVLALAFGQWGIAALTGRGILAALGRLRAGTQAVGAGALDHEVEAAAQDEIGELARSFNAMTRRLREITASRDELNREVAERRRTEERLGESEAKYHSLFDNLPQKIFLKDTASVYVAVNPAYAADLGLAPEAIVGKTDLDLFPQEVAEKYRADDRQILESGRRLEADEIFAQGGSQRAVHTIKMPLRDAAGRVTGLLGVFWDITERKRAEQALKESERRLWALLENVPLIAVMLDVHGRILFCNDYCLELTGWRREEVVGRNWFDLFVPPQLGVRELFHATLLKGELPRHYENPILTRTGEQRHIAWSNTVFTDRGGPIVGVTSLGADLTERRTAEEQLHRALAELERSNKELEQFAYVASHDLQEPLRTVGSFAELVVQRYRGQLDEDGREFLGYMVDGAQRAQRLINDLLQYSRVGSRGKPFEEVGGEAVLGQALDNLQAAIEEAGAAVTHDPLPALKGDPTQLVQLFQNLVGNAIKFRRPEEACRVHVSCAEEPARRIFTVRDNGIGIAPQYFDRIFVIFQRLHSRSRYPGTGIGLAVCKKIVERHGGRIWVESEPGRGSSFHVALPRAPRDPGGDFVPGDHRGAAGRPAEGGTT